MHNSRLALAAVLAPVLLAAAPAHACFFGCRPDEAAGRAVFEHLLAKRYNAPFSVLAYETLRTADFDLIAGKLRGFEIFYKATVKFPEGVNLDCAPGAASRPDDCTDDAFFTLIRPTRPDPDKRQYVEPNGQRSFDENLRFVEQKDGSWRGLDGDAYKPR